MVDINSYDSRWDYMADKVGVPRKPTFDGSVTNFTIVGRFIGDWNEELNNLLNQTNNGESYNFLAKKTKDSSEKGHKTKELNKSDMNKMSMSENYEFVKKIRNVEMYDVPLIKKMIDWFGFEGTVVSNIHVQSPGHVFPYHFDNLITVRGNKAELTEEETHQYGRVEIMLRDWEYGHIWGIGNSYWSNWRAGEIMFHPWHNVPHGTANAGMYPRINLQVTGKMNDELKTRLNRHNGDIIL